VPFLCPEAQTVHEAGRLAGIELGGHVELALLLMTPLVEVDGEQPDRLLRDALAD
jgi:hypothetical protein